VRHPLKLNLNLTSSPSFENHLHSSSCVPSTKDSQSELSKDTLASRAKASPLKYRYARKLLDRDGVRAGMYTVRHSLHAAKSWRKHINTI
jgi:hypothetical protein